MYTVAYFLACVRSAFVHAVMLRVVHPLYIWWVFREAGTSLLVRIHVGLYALMFDRFVREVLSPSHDFFHSSSFKMSFGCVP